MDAVGRGSLNRGVCGKKACLSLKVVLIDSVAAVLIANNIPTRGNPCYCVCVR